MTQLFTHQAEHVAAHWDNKWWGLWHEMGTGKTPIVLNSARQLFHNRFIGGVVVIAPAECYLNWLKEIPKHTPEMSAVAWDSGHVTRTAKNVEWLKQQQYPVFVVNIEALSRDKPTCWNYIIGFFSTRKPILLVVDESSCIKNPKAKCTKNVMKLGQYATYRRCLNGTPGIETPFDTWAQLEFLCPGSTGMNYFMFTKTYGIWKRQYYGPRNFDKVVGYRDIEDVRRLLMRHGDFVYKRDCLDLPEKLYQTYHVQLPPEVMKVYADFKKHQVALLDGQVVAADNALDLATKLHDLATGFIKNIDDSITWVSTFKIDKLVELLKSINGKAIIYCSSRPTIAALMEKLNAEFYGQVDEIHGDVDMQERPEIVRWFQEEDMARFLVCNQQTAGRGITLTAASYVIYFRNSYSLERRVQSEDRAHRIGQDKNVTYIDVVCDGTIDERVVDALERKLDVANILLQIVKEELDG